VVQSLGWTKAMELFLNFLWVLIALAALGVWRVCWMREQRTQRRNPVREWAAVVCALVLLFFAVSLSDDLHSSLALLEESAASRRHSAYSNAGHPNPNSPGVAPIHPAAHLTGTIVFPPLLAFVLPSISVKRPHDFAQSGLRLGRAPPYSRS
jgi:hypothetical protein